MVLYFANPTGGAVAEMIAGNLGFIDTPLQGNRRPAGVTWCADNGCFNDETFNETRWFNWLKKHAGDAGTCLFATAPDVYGDAAATLERSRPWLSKIRALGYPAAFVAQDGQEHLPVPWDEFDVLFIGGRKSPHAGAPFGSAASFDRQPEWKLSSAARALVKEAKARGKWVHCGRVNTAERFRWCAAVGVDSADGTFVTRAPRKNVPIVMGWVRAARDQFPLFNLDEEIA